MSVVVGVVTDTEVVIAADTSLHGETISHSEAKLHETDSAYIGWVGSPLWGSFVRNWTEALNGRRTIEAFGMAWFDWAREKQHGDMSGLTYLVNGAFLIGTKASGRLFEVTGDGAVCEHHRYAAIGGGEAVAIGALSVVYGGNGEWVARRAVEAAIRHAPSCGGSVNILGATREKP